jgi:ribosome-dependent ATPase
MSGVAAPASAPAPVVRLRDVGLHYGKAEALHDITLDIPAGVMAGLIGPDGVGKSSLLALIAGRACPPARAHRGAGRRHGQCALSRRGMPAHRLHAAGLGKNLYPTLSVFENVDFFGRLFGHDRAERERRIGALLAATGLAPFADRPAGKLSGGMKQKLGLCCALIHDPDLLILDEPTTGVDPLSRRAVLGADRRHPHRAPRHERAGGHRLHGGGRAISTGWWRWMRARARHRRARRTAARTGCDTLEQAFIALLPEAQRAGYRPVEIVPHAAGADGEVAIEARESDHALWRLHRRGPGEFPHRGAARSSASSAPTAAARPPP